MSFTETGFEAPREAFGGEQQWWLTAAASVEVLGGEVATPAALKHEEERQTLIALIRRFAYYGLSWTAGQCAPITRPTQMTAAAFLNSLPAGKALPKVSPDGEGGLMMIWEDQHAPVLLTIDNLYLHAVIAATTPRAEYLDDIPFDWLQRIPQKILDAIPAR
jgi:hypothetical protein